MYLDIEFLNGWVRETLHDNFRYSEFLLDHLKKKKQKWAIKLHTQLFIYDGLDILTHIHTQKKKYSYFYEQKTSSQQ